MDNPAEAAIESLAKSFHIAWMEWTMNIAKTEKISQERLDRWKDYWVAYERLPDKVKEQDRVFARIAFVMLGMALEGSEEDEELK